MTVPAIDLPPNGSRWKNASDRVVTVVDCKFIRARGWVVSYVYPPSKRMITKDDPIGQPTQKLELTVWARIFSTRVEEE